MADTVLHRCLLQCRYSGVAPSTRQTYQSGLNAFTKFCSEFGIPPFPASSLTLEYFCVHTAQHVSYKTLKVYLSGIRLAHIERGMADPTKSTSLHLVCRGIHRQQGDNQKPRLPITINLLRVLKEQLRASTLYTTLEQQMLWALFTVAFYGFFRASELIPNLRWSHITLSSTQVSITLLESKTDPFRRGSTIHLFPTGSSTCPIKAMTVYAMRVDTAHNNPVFQAGRFNSLTQKKLNAILRNLLQQANVNHVNYSSHSFRIGAATTAAAAGLPPWLIKALGRWHSDAYLAYIRCPVSVYSSVLQILASTDASHQPPWDPDITI